MSNKKMEYQQDVEDSKEGFSINYPSERKFFENVGLSKKELKKLENGDTCFIGNKRLRELLDKSKIT